MITLFTIPKAFTGRARIQQRNAIASWRAVSRDMEIFLFGDDPGVHDAAEEFDCVHWPTLSKTPHGTPVLAEAFDVINREAKWPIAMFSNSDILLLPQLCEVTPWLTDLPSFLLCGSRIDCDLETELDWQIPIVTQRQLEEVARSRGVLHGPMGSDYFMFRRGTLSLPPFAVGRPGWDNWVIFWARQNGWPVIDASQVMTVIHQNHDYSHSSFGAKSRVVGPEFHYNVRLAGGYHKMLDLRAATCVLTKDGVRPTPPLRSLESTLLSLTLTRRLFGAIRAMRDARSNRELIRSASIGR